jgi:hypothetical protein
MSRTKTTRPRRPRANDPSRSAAAAEATTASSGAAARAAVSPEERHRMIAEAAYYRALARGFSGGDPLADWLEAEAEIDRMLSATPRQ